MGACGVRVRAGGTWGTGVDLLGQAPSCTVELSSFQLESTAHFLRAATVLNVSPRSPRPHQRGELCRAKRVFRRCDTADQFSMIRCDAMPRAAARHLSFSLRPPSGRLRGGSTSANGG